MSETIESGAAVADPPADSAWSEQAELFETLGRLCHQINNPLTTLMGRSQILQLGAETDPRVTKAAQAIEEAAGKLAEHIRKLAHVVNEGRDRARSAVGAAVAPADE